MLPFRFINLTENSTLLTNLVGEHHITNSETLRNLVNHELDGQNQEYIDLRSKHFLTDSKTQIAKNLLSVKLRTKYRRISEFTSLHMFVVSLRCEHSCPYCQVSRQSQDKLKYDMSEEVASKGIDIALSSPASNVKIEFQGGESLLNFELIK